MDGGDLMKTVIKITVDGQDIYLEQQPDGSWEKRTAAPSYPGVYPISVTIESENGTITVIGYDDETLGEFLKLIVQGKSISGKRMLDYLPQIYKEFSEFQTMMESEGIEVDRLLDGMQIVVSDAFILSASENRISQWEKAFGIIPSGSLADRQRFVLSTIRGQGKLSEPKIQTIVNAFTGGTAVVTFSNSILVVKILVPEGGDNYRFEDVERAIKPRLPAHLGISVLRWYASWQDIPANFSNWESLKNLSNWKAVKEFIPPQ